jgi:hypothetical protein
MLPVCRWLMIVLGVVGFAARTDWAQSKAQRPKILVDLEKPAAREQSRADGIGVSLAGERFGISCPAPKNAIGKYGTLDKPASISELMGAPIKEVRIRKYGQRWKSAEDVRSHVSELLKKRTETTYSSVPWAEIVYPDILARIQFSDKTRGTLEESGDHVCFTDHSGTAVWLRLNTAADKQ